MTTTAVVILNYNGQDFLRKFLPSVVSFSEHADVYVADNGSTDQSVALVERDFPSVKIIRLYENYGFCGGYNRALREIHCDYYILLNSDVEVTPGWIAPLKKILDTNQNAGAIQPKVLSYEQRDRFEYAGAAGGFVDSLGYPFCRGRIFDFVEKDTKQYDDTRQVFWATGACLMIRAPLYRQFGGLDEDFFAHMEEIDLCWKLQRAGFEVWYSGKSTVYHLGAGTLGYANQRKTYLNFRNGLIMITKHFDTGEIIWKLPLRISLDWLAATTFLFRRQLPHTKAVLRAHRTFLRHMRKTMAKRRILRNSYPSYPRDSVFRGLVIIEYFLKGRRKLIR